MNRGFCEADKTVGRGFSAYIVVLEHEQIPLLSRGGVAATSREFREATLASLRRGGLFKPPINR